MTRPEKALLVAIMAVLIISQVGILRRADAGASDVTTKTIAAALRDQIALCGSSLEVVYTQELPGGDPESAPYMCRYIRTAEVLCKERIAEDGSRTRYSLDKLAQEYRETEIRSGSAHSISRMDKSRVFTSTQDVEPILYYLKPNALVDMIGRGEMSAAMERVDGHACYRVSIPIRSEAWGNNTVWVDPSIGFCPRRIVSATWSGREKAAVSYQDYREIKPGLWFPMKQTVRSIYSGGCEHVTTNTVKSVSIGKLFTRDDLL